MTPMHLSSDLLRIFVTVADSGSVSGGAARLGRTQSAVSMQLRKLEEIAGCSLFTRGARGVIPTAAGEALLGQARRILGMLAEAEATLSSEPLAGRVSIGVPEEYGAPVLPGVLAHFGEKHSGVEVSVHCEPTPSLETLFEAGELDLAVLVIDSGRRAGELLAYDTTVWVTSTRHLVHEADPLPVAMYGQDCWWRPWALKALDERDRHYRVAYTSRSVAGIQAAVTSGLAVAVLAHSTMPPHSRILDAGEGFPELPGSAVVLRWNEQHRSAASAGMAEAVRRAFRAQGG
jgi:DNA-binding transcriptional LysR family regulator